MTPAPASRVVLLPAARRTPGSHAEKIRRYRLARMRLVDRRRYVSGRHAHLGQSYD
jgi:hypothetical protein